MSAEQFYIKINLFNLLLHYTGWYIAMQYSYLNFICVRHGKNQTRIAAVVPGALNLKKVLRHALCHEMMEYSKGMACVQRICFLVKGWRLGNRFSG
jgi:hypothetical protein